MSAARLRVAYFTVVPLHYQASGGALCCLDHVRRLAAEPELDLTVHLCGAAAEEPLNRAVVEPTGAALHFVPYELGTRGARAPGGILGRRWPFLYEAVALGHPHVEAALVEELRRSRPDALVVDYVPSAAFLKSVYRSGPPIVTVTLNREGAFYRDLRRHRAVPPGASSSRVAEARVRAFERWVYRRSSAVVALTSADLPTFHGRPRIREVIPPAFDPSPERWSWTGRRYLSFVGSVGHYPNRLAVEWLATRLAPALEQLRADVDVRIVGVAATAAPESWRRENVTFLGEGDRDLVTRELTGGGAFVAPIANRFGAKIKLLDCLAHGTPFLASDEALTGLPFVSKPLAPVQLDDPAAVAREIVRLFAEPSSVVRASERLAAELESFLLSQRGVWSDLLRRVAACG